MIAAQAVCPAFFSISFNANMGSLFLAAEQSIVCTSNMLNGFLTIILYPL